MTAKDQDEQPPAPPPGIVSARELRHKTFPPRMDVIPDILPTGATILAAKSGAGKSWMMLDWAIAVATGGRAFGDIEVQPGRVLYLALEDTLANLQERLGMRLGGEDEWPDRLDIRTEWPRMDINGGREGEINLRAYLDARRDTRLVIVDTLEWMRKPPRRDNPYSDDVDAIRPFKLLADTYNLALVATHHTTKDEEKVDPLDLISGTMGLTGTFDHRMVLHRPGSYGPQLVMRGRLMRARDIHLAWDADTCAWGINEEPDEVDTALSFNQQDVLRALRHLNERWGCPVKPSDVAAACNKDPKAVAEWLRRLDKHAKVYKPSLWAVHTCQPGRCAREEALPGQAP